MILYNKEIFTVDGEENYNIWMILSMTFILAYSMTGDFNILTPILIFSFMLSSLYIFLGDTSYLKDLIVAGIVVFSGQVYILGIIIYLVEILNYLEWNDFVSILGETNTAFLFNYFTDNFK